MYIEKGEGEKVFLQFCSPGAFIINAMALDESKKRGKKNKKTFEKLSSSQSPFFFFFRYHNISHHSGANFMKNMILENCYGWQNLAPWYNHRQIQIINLITFGTVTQLNETNFFLTQCKEGQTPGLVQKAPQGEL